MKSIIAETTGEVWKKAATEVFTNGQAVRDGDIQLKESLNIFLTVRHPLLTDSILEKYAESSMIEWMKNNFFEQEPVAGWGYSYGQRFFAYDGTDQVSEAIQKLKKNPESKSATISLMDPAGDKKHMPCITVVDFKIRNNALMTTAFFRSQDVGKKLYADCICLGEIAKKISDEVKVVAGDLNILIVSLHAYEADWNKVREIIAS